ncbi:hypothetical protein Trydic_g8912 [Trypoxylus dichotomus]
MYLTISTGSSHTHQDCIDGLNNTMEIIVDSKEDTSPNYSVSFVDVSTIKQESNCEDEQEWSEIDITEEPIDANDIKEEPVEISVCKTEAPCLKLLPTCRCTSDCSFSPRRRTVLRRLFN